MSRSIFPKLLFASVVLLVGAYYSRPKSLKQQFELAGLHPRLNSIKEDSYFPQYQYCFDGVGKDPVLAVLQKAGYKINFMPTRADDTTIRLVKMKSIPNWQVDQGVSVHWFPTNAEMKTSETLLTTNKKL